MLRLFSFLFYRMPYEASKGFDACCPHFQQNDAPAWTKDEAEIINAKWHETMVLVYRSKHNEACALINTMSVSVQAQTCGRLCEIHTLTKAIVSHPAQVAQSIRQHITLWSTSFGLKEATINFVFFNWYLSHFKIQTKRLDPDQAPPSPSRGQKPRRYTAILWEKGSQTHRLQ